MTVRPAACRTVQHLVVFDGRNPYNGTTPPLGTGCNPDTRRPQRLPHRRRTTTWSAVKQMYDKR
jgi:hypothetical protein